MDWIVARGSKYRAIEAGREVSIIPRYDGCLLRAQAQTLTVAPPCENPNNGRWHCVTCHESFQNQLQKDCHIGERKHHEFVWLCSEHGPEDATGEA